MFKSKTNVMITAKGAQRSCSPEIGESDYKLFTVISISTVLLLSRFVTFTIEVRRLFVIIQIVTFYVRFYSKTHDRRK